MSANCNFSKKYLPLVYYKVNTTSKEEFENWVRDTFINADTVISLVKNGELFKSSLSSSRKKIEYVPSIARKIIDSGQDNSTIDSLYLGRTDLRIQMEQRFMQDIVALTVFDRFANNGRGEWVDFDKKALNGLSQGNENIRLYKCNLIEELYSEMSPEENPLYVYENMTPQEYDGTIKTVLKNYRNFLKSHPEAGKAFTAYSILQNFDELIRAKAPFIEFNDRYTYDFADKYTYKGPTVEHYTGFSTDESATIEKQDSDLAKILLNTIPEIDENGKPIEGSFIGLSGFNSAMTSLKRALLFSPHSFSDKTRETYFNGLDVDLNALIDEYITNLSTYNPSISKEHRTYLISKLKGIQKYIYQSGIDPVIKNMFTQMFFKTELVSYRGYSYDNESNSIKGKNLRINTINSQRYQLEDWIRGAGYLLLNNRDIKERLKKAYNIQYNNGVLTISSGPMNTMVFTFDNKGNNKSKLNITVSGNYESAFAEKAISDFLAVIVPDTYTSVGIQLSGRTFRLMDDFAYPLGLVLGAVYGDVQGIRKSTSGIIDLKDHIKSLDETARKLSVIYGSETKNTVKSPSGNNLPSYQLTNLSYNVASLLHDVSEFSKKYPESENSYKNPYENSLFIKCKDLLTDLQVRSEIKIGNIVKSTEQLTTKELIQLSTIEDFYKPLIGDGIIYLQNATFADKVTHYLPGYNTNVDLKDRLNLREALTAILNGEQSTALYDFTRQTRLKRLDFIVNNILLDYKKAFLNDKGMLKNGYGCSVDFNFTSLEGLDTFLQNGYKIENGKHVPFDINIIKSEIKTFQEEVHATEPKNEVLGKVRVNETLLAQYNDVKQSTSWNKRVKSARKKFIDSISKNKIKWNRYDGGTMYKIWDTYRNKLSSEWFDDNSGDMKLFVGNKLHPILEAYFISDLLLSHEYNAITIGEVWAHPNKNKDLTNLEGMPNYNPTKEQGTYEEFSEASRLVSQIKRSVVFGATYHPFAQNLSNGVASEIDVAVMEDIPGWVFTPNGDDTTIDSMDGSGYADDLQARFESNSLIDARVGENKKTIMMDIDERYGKPILLKWAVYSLTNEIRRISVKSKVSAENLCKKMRSKPIRNVENVSDYYNQRENKIIYEDYRTGKHYRIDNVAFENGQYVQYITEISDHGEETTNKDRKSFATGTLYDLDQLFGGAWTCKYEDGQWIYSDDNTDMLEEILSRSENQDLKKGFISYVVNKSAIKVGAGAVNSVDSWSDNSELETISMHSKYGGLQMDADHDLEHSEVSEMTQMISALVQGGHYPELVEEIYRSLGDVVINHLSKYEARINIINSPNATEEEKEKAKTDLREILGKSLIAAFQTGSKDTLGLAQAFVEKASEALRNNKHFDIPFSAATINGAFISDIMAGINKGGIRRKFAGFAGVLNPSNDIIQTYRIWNEQTKSWETMLFNQFAKRIRDLGFVGDNFDAIFTEPTFNVEIDPTTNKITTITSNNPFIREIEVEDIDFEDTVYINGSSEPIYINNPEKYYKTKIPGNRVFIDTRAPRNLRGACTYFTDVVGHTHNMYDLKSIADTYFLTQWIKLADDKKDVIEGFNELKFKNSDLYELFYKDKEALSKLTIQDLQYRLKQAKDQAQRDLKTIERKGTVSIWNGKISTKVTVSDYKTRPAEVITGRYQWEKFGLGPNDHIQDIKDSTIFKEKLRGKYDPLKDDINTDLYDIILYGPRGERFYVKIGNITSINETYSKHTGITDSNVVKVNGDNVYFSDEVYTSTKDKQFKMLVDEYGKQTQLIAVESIDAFRDLIKSGWFDKFYQHFNYNEDNVETLRAIEFYNAPECDIWTDGQYGPIVISKEEPSVEDFIRHREILKDKKINRAAEDMYESFKIQLHSIGARIPTQGMQSFMPTDCIAVVDNLKNVLYVPKMDPFLKGSDFDIDKDYKMMFYVNEHGRIDLGDPLQDIFGLQVAIHLSSPNGISYSEGEGGIEVDYHSVLGALEETPMLDWDLIHLFNSIYDNKSGLITFVNFPGNKRDNDLKNRFLRIVNLHSKANNVLTLDQLKNAVMAKSQNIVTKPQNQLIAQIPINMEEPQAAAKRSTLGRAEKHLTSDNPATKFEMQVQNMVGKEVIGISAVAMKGYFAMSYVYNVTKLNKVKEAIDSGNGDLIANAIDDLLIKNPFNGEVTSISNLDVDRIFDMFGNPQEDIIITIKNDPNRSKLFDSIYLDCLKESGIDVFNTYEIGKAVNRRVGLDSREIIDINLTVLLNELKKRVNRTDAAGVISAIISSATDNAKELLLAKINAVPGLVDIYTYLTIVGVPFKQIADFMTSDTISYIKSIGEKDIFDSSTNGYNVDKAIDFYLGTDLPSGIEREVLAVYSSLYNTSAGKQGKTWIKTDELLNILNDSSQVNSLIENINKDIVGSKLNGEQLDQLWDIYYASTGEENTDNRNVTLNPFQVTQLRNAIKFLELCLDRNKFKALHPSELDQIERLHNILPAVKEMSTFGQFLGINQGLRTNLFDFLRFKDRLADFLEDNSDFEEDIYFDLDEFISNPEYRLSTIKHYDAIKQTFNIFEALTDIPHFWEMTKTMYISHNLAKINSIKTRILTNLYYDIKSNVEERTKAKAKKRKDPGTIKLNEKEFKSLEAYVNDVFIAKFLKDSNFSVIIETDAGYYPSIISENTIHPYEVRVLKLNTAENVASFKHWMDSYVIPEIIRTHSGNAFVDNLRPLANVIQRTGKEITGWKLPLQMMDIEDSPNTIQLYSEILEGFDEIANQDGGRFGRNIGDLFYVYNMIINKDSFGQNSLTRLFEDVIQVNPNSMANQFNDYLVKMDNTEIKFEELGISSNEAKYRIKRDNPESRVSTTISIKELGSDYTLDLPKFYDMPVKNVLSEEELHEKKKNLPQPAFKYTLNEQSLLIELIKQLEKRLPATSDSEAGVQIHLITDDELIEFKEMSQYDDIKDSKGFVLNGDIYINISKATGDPVSVFLHEFAHLVMASMKFDPKSRDIYYTLLAEVKDYPMFNKIAEKYPNAIGSDLYEEVFANLLETYLSGREYIPIDALDESDTSYVLSGFMTNNTDTILKSISYLLGLTTPIKDRSDVIGKTIDEIMSRFGYNLLNSTIEISKTSVINSQILNTVKQDLYENNKLTTTCDEA